MNLRNSEPSDRCIEASNTIAEMTNKLCSNCTIPFGCCSDEYGQMVEDMFPEKTFTYSTVKNPKCRFLETDGCTVSPEYRPICSIHACENKLMTAFLDEAWHDKYWEQRAIICNELYL